MQWPSNRTIMRAALALALSSTALPLTPPTASAERRAILDALRPTIEAKIGADVEIVVTDLRVEKG